MRARALRRQVRGRASAVGPFALAALMLPGLSGCSSDGPQGSSSTHWLTCEVDAECADLVLGASCGQSGYCEAASGARLEQRVVFEESFDAPLDQTTFAAEVGTLIRNDEAQAYTDRPENISSGSGELVLTARAEAWEGASFTSGSVHTSGQRAFTFGRIEARMQTPLATGCASAFWLLPENPMPDVPSCDKGSCYMGTWPAWGDITIASRVSSAPESVSMALNYGVWNDALGAVEHFPEHHQAPVPDGGWHVYAIEWTPTRIDWLVDGALVASADLSPDNLYRPDGRHPFHQPFHLRLNLALGGLDQAPNAAEYPQELRVDWVRVLQWVEPE